MPRGIHQKLSDEQRAVIVENDPVAGEKLKQLWEQVKNQEITPERARRLQSNIEGIAIDKWRRRCSQLGEPLSSPVGQQKRSTLIDCRQSSQPSSSQRVDTRLDTHTG